MHVYSSFVCNVISGCYNLCISNDYSVYSFGESSKGAHGFNGEANTIYPPQQIKGLINIINISCGIYHSCCLDYEGNVFSFGDNQYGQLGRNKLSNNLTHTHIPQKCDIPPIKKISCGGYFTVCLSYDGDVYGFGNNYYGQLSLGHNEHVFSPQLIPDLNNIEFIVCGGTHIICKTYNNEYYSCGNNKYGQLGHGNNNDKCNKPIQCLNWPDNIISMKCGLSFSLLLTEEGQLYSFGSNDCGQLGFKNNRNKTTVYEPLLITDIPEIQRIECGDYEVKCIDINNNLWCFGKNSNGQLGLGDRENRYKPIQHPTLSNIIDISSGGDHTFVKTMDNKIYAFGRNTYAQNSLSDILTPKQVFQDNKYIWLTAIRKSRAKSARK